ncbi:MAG: AAA family ATPase [Treponematales bacterium]
MIKRIEIKRYRKLKDITFSFSKHINVISGTNGTCKTSLLHLISNSVKELNKKCAWISDLRCLDIIRGVNNALNPKVETLTKGDKEYNDPAPEYKGTLFTVNYFNSNPLEFRRHVSSTMARYAVKPWYKRNTNDSLPFCPVIYLGLSRLFAFGEFQDDEALSAINKSFPENYQQELIKTYKDFTRYEISTLSPQLMGNIKKRTEFISNVPGIDSNTISAGEDNLMIILIGLISLRMYYENISSTNDVESILLIDELDATLHPYFQIKLLDLFIEYSKAYKIQFFFTTHSLSLLEKCLKQQGNCHVEYLVDSITKVVQMTTPDIFKIKLDLSHKLQQNIYEDVCLPVFTEDDESRLFSRILFDEISKFDKNFHKKIRNLFYMPEISVGAENLRKMFSDSKIVSTTIRSICILDGDQKPDLSNYIITLPGEKSPEMVAFEHLQTLIASEDHFWESDFVFTSGYSKPKCIEEVIPRIQSIDAKNASLNEKGETTKGQRRKGNKEVFNAYIDLFEVVLSDWTTKHISELFSFADNLHKMFLKVSGYHNVNPADWEKLSDALNQAYCPVLPVETSVKAYTKKSDGDKNGWLFE